MTPHDEYLSVTELQIPSTSRTATLEAEVETLFGKKVLYLLRPGIHERAAAVLDRKDDTPTIEFRAEDEIEESTVFHELYHLKLLAEGFPIYNLSFSSAMTPYEGSSRQVYETIRAAMQHAHFFPIMRNQGFDPTAKSRSVITGMKVPQRGNRARDRGDFHNAADLFATHMAGDQIALAAHIEALRRCGWTFSVEKANQAYEVVRRLGFDQPRREADALVAALNVLFEDQPRAILQRWVANRQKRSTYSLNEAELML